MGYACPVCSDPQADGEHLANHLAFCAMLGREGHEAWLDEHAPGWDQQGPEELAERVTEAVPETEFPQVFEDTTADEGDHDHEHSFEEEIARGANHRGAGAMGGSAAGGGRGALTDDTEDVLEEARRMTEAMMGSDGEAETDDGSEGTATDGEDGAAASRAGGDGGDDGDGTTTDDGADTDEG